MKDNLISMAIPLVFPAMVLAESTFNLPVSLKAPQMSEAEKSKNQCYILARHGHFVKNEVKKAAWFQSSDENFVWRVTQFNSGLVCSELIEGRYNRQFGPGAVYTGCECQGAIEVIK